ncbi:MAG: hypothetical protein MJ203_04900 [archaeon]|nr:hypothetical protein [archaeon]
MLGLVLLLSGLVIDTFILTSVNGLTYRDNLKTYLGIETALSIVGFLIGSVILLYMPADTFKFICGLIIIAIQLIEMSNILNFPEKVNALLLGSDSLVIFATLTWIYIPILLYLSFVLLH